MCTRYMLCLLSAVGTVLAPKDPYIPMPRNCNDVGYMAKASLQIGLKTLKCQIGQDYLVGPV